MNGDRWAQTMAADMTDATDASLTTAELELNGGSRRKMNDSRARPQMADDSAMKGRRREHERQQKQG